MLGTVGVDNRPRRGVGFLYGPEETRIDPVAQDGENRLFGVRRAGCEIEPG
jgi:hypothetical protein